MKIPARIVIEDVDVSPTNMAISFVHGDSREQTEFLSVLGREAFRMNGWAMQCRFIATDFGSFPNKNKLISALEILIEHLKETP